MKRFRDSDSLHEHLKELDLKIAVEIAGFAGIEVRDRRGNLSPEVWVRHSDRMSVGQLIEASDLRTLLMEQIKQHLQEQKELLQQLEDDQVVVTWILKFVKTWEDAYKNRVNRNFDISQKILTAMTDAVTEIKPTLDLVGIDWNTTRDLIDDIINSDPEDVYLDSEEALTRFMFRNEITGPMMRRLAGKILQKSIVCNKAGAYSAKIQRNDVTQEKAYALRDVLVFFNEQPVRCDQLKAMLQDPQHKTLFQDPKKKEAIIDTLEAHKTLLTKIQK